LTLPSGSSDPKEKRAAEPDRLQEFAADFWAWRDQHQPYSSDDIPRIEQSAGKRDWSAASIAKQRADLSQLETRWKQMNPAGWSVSQQVDYRLMGSALARVRWELDVNRRWERDPTFYLHQTLTALLECLVQPPPFDAQRSQAILSAIEQTPAILEKGKANLQAVRPFAQLAIDSLRHIRSELSSVEKQVAPMLQDGGSQAGGAAMRFQAASAKAITAFESYRSWLEQHLSAMPEKAAVGRANYEFFLSNVALLAYTPEQLVSMSRQEWERSVSFEEIEKQRNQTLPELKIAATVDEQIRNSERDELAIRKFCEAKGILTVPLEIGHYTIQLAPGYLDMFAGYGELNDFLHATGVRYVNPPSPNLGYFWLATAKDPRPDMVHEGIPGHYFQLALSRLHENPIRRRYYDSGPNEGIGFYAEEMMLQAGLFDNSPRSREIIYNFMRLRALRVEVDVKLALGSFTIEQAADYLATHVPMDKRTAQHEAAAFATNPGQAITYQIGKIQVLRFLADAKLRQRDAFTLRGFHDYLWKNGNVPVSLLRWEYLGLDDDVRTVDELRIAGAPHSAAR
jgi:uncharacterized protein (DUF885 family)